MAGVARARAAAAASGLTCVPGIEITAVDRDLDVHVLGYFLDPDEPRLREFLAAQRCDRVRRIGDMAALLARLGCRIDIGPALAAAEADTSRSIGRPVLARALVDAGWAANTTDAFARLVGRGCPGYVSRRGASPFEVIAIIHDAGGLTSLAHPGQTACDELLPALATAGLDALEVRHPDHPPELEARYRAAARALDLAVTGGSDYHGNPEHGAASPGSVTITQEEFDAFAARRRI